MCSCPTGYSPDEPAFNVLQYLKVCAGMMTANPEEGFTCDDRPGTVLAGDVLLSMTPLSR